MIAARLAELIGAEQVSADAEALASHRFDRWCLKHWQDWHTGAFVKPCSAAATCPIILESERTLLLHRLVHLRFH